MLKRWHILLLIIFSVVVVYFQSVKNDFVNLDDGYYVYNNQLIQSFSKNLFTEFVIGNYHPLTMLSYAIEFRLGGLDPALYHFTNLLFHLFNCLLVFYLIFLLTNNQFISIFTAVLFAVHPMHVESVAWISSRKDLLYTFFFLLSMIAYLQYTRTEKIKFYWATLLFFIFSLLSKAMAVTLPLCLLLADYISPYRKFNFQYHLTNKIPFLAISFLFGLLAVKAQASFDAFGGNPMFPFLHKFFFAGYGLFIYFIKFIIPFRLNCFYEYPPIVNGFLPVEYYISTLIFIGLLSAVWMFFRQNRFVMFGSLFFIMNVLLVSQMITVGSCVIAERYTYVSYIGLCFISGYSLDKLSVRFTHYKNPIIINGICVILIFIYIAYNRVSVWKNSGTLWTDAIENNPASSSALLNRAVYYSNEKQYENAFADYNKAIELEPNDYKVYSNRGMAYFETENYMLALNDFTRAIQLRPNLHKIMFYRAKSYEMIGSNQSAIYEYKKLLNNNLYGKEAREAIKRLNGNISQ